MDLILKSFQQIGDNLAVHILFWTMLFDIGTGYAKSVVWKVTDSNVGWKGLIKHSLVFSFFLILLPYADAFGWLQFANILIIIYAGNYVLSILENFGVMGIYVPEFLENKVKAEIQRYEKMAEKIIANETRMVVEEQEVKTNNEEEK